MQRIWHVFKNITKGFCLGFKDSLIGFFLLCKYYLPFWPSSTRKSATESDLTSLAKKRSAQKVKQAKPKSNDEEKNVMGKVIQMCGINTLIFGFSSAAFYAIVMPILNFCTSFIDSEDQSLWSLYLHPICVALFHTFWLIPIYVTMKFLNAFWCQDVAFNAFWQRRGRPQSNTSIGSSLGDLIFTICVQFFFIAQASITNIPISIVFPSYIKITFEYVHMALLNSLYAFEYSWIYRGWSLDVRLSYVGKYWPYFIGFGCIPTTIALIIPSVILSGCIYAILFPIFIISANEAAPFRGDNGCSLKKLFVPAVCIVGNITDFVTKFTYPTAHTTSNKSFQ